VFGLAPSAIGLAFALPAMGYAAGNFIAGRFSVRFGMNPMIVAGTMITTCGLALLALLTWAGLSGPVTFFVAMVALGVGNGMALPNANAGMLSVRPDLAGTASGLGGAIVIGGGAALSALAVAALPPGSEEMPLIGLMLGCSVVSTLSITPLLRRARRL
jgi:DHA1 family bicyclomycin/chloramphenicol resistance-like MFS transporter